MVGGLGMLEGLSPSHQRSGSVSHASGASGIKGRFQSSLRALKSAFSSLVVREGAQAGCIVTGKQIGRAHV